MFVHQVDMSFIFLACRVPDDVVDAYLQRLGLSGEDWVRVDPAQTQAPATTTSTTKGTSSSAPRAAGQAVQAPYVLARLRALVRVSAVHVLFNCGVW